MVIPNENVKEFVGVLQAAFQDQLKGHKVLGSIHLFLTERVNEQAESRLMVVHSIPSDLVTAENFDRIYCRVIKSGK